MTLEELCKNIGLSHGMTMSVLEYDKSFAYDANESICNQLLQESTWQRGLKEVEALLGDDPDGVGILTIMLHYAVVFAWEQYRKLGISEEIYFDTMKCFSRFIGECVVMDGHERFDRAFWTVRQISALLFRIGELEYELTSHQGQPVISLHIPSDAKLTEEACNDSLHKAEAFIQNYFPEYSGTPMVCESWLLSPALKELLPKDSHIRQFQDRFRVVQVLEDDTGYIEWVFRTRSREVQQFSEKTGLQRRMKEFLLNGGKVGAAFAYLVKPGQEIPDL